MDAFYIDQCDVGFLASPFFNSFLLTHYAQYSQAQRSPAAAIMFNKKLIAARRRQLAIDRILVLYPSDAAWCTARPLVSSSRLVLYFSSFLQIDRIRRRHNRRRDLPLCPCFLPATSFLFLFLFLFLISFSLSYLYINVPAVTFIVITSSSLLFVGRRTHTHRLTGSSQSSFL